MSDERSKVSTETFTTETKYNMETGLPLASFTRLNGLKQAPPDGSPSYTLYDELGRPKMMQWHDQGELHREDAGASIYIDPETSVHVGEHFFLHGRERPAHLGPFWICRDSTTGKVTETEYKGGSARPRKAKPPSPS